MTVTGHHIGAIVLTLAGVLGTVSAPMAGVADGRQSSEPDRQASAQPSAGDVSPEQVDRVRQALEHKPLVELTGQQLQFYVQIIGRPPKTFADYARGSDLMHGPTRRGNPMSHQEFLNMVTPRDFYSSGGITPFELLQFALTNWVGQTLVRRGLDEINAAKTEREKQEIRDRIDRELLILQANEGNSR